MTNNENKSKEKWSLKKTILFIVLVVLLFATMFSCGLNTFKTTYNQVNQVNYNENSQVLTDYNSFNKIDRDIKKTNASLNDIRVLGTTINNSGYIDKVYFNTYFNLDIYTEYFSQLTYLENSLLPIPYYPILMTQTGQVLIIENHPAGYVINLITSISNQSYVNIGIINYYFEDISYVSSLNYSEYTLNSNLVSEYMGISIGYQNELLNRLISSTPFELNVECGGSYTPNPQYNIVHPSINGDLVLGTLIEPNLESQTTFSELYVSYIIGASDYTYSLNMVINLVLEGVNNYYNISIANNLNINDLSNSSYTNVIANFDSDLEELNLVIEVYSNNSVIYTYNNSFPCVMNNSITYPYQVNGFSNTPTAKQYVSSYNSTQAYNNGLNIGSQEGYANGYDVGYDEGYDEGYNYTDENGNYRGYEQGYHDGSNNEFAKDGVKDLVNIIFNAPYNIFNGFLNFEIFGVNLFNLLSFIFTLVLVGWIIALLMKR